MAERFYVNCDLAVASVVLEGPEAHHLRDVRRLRPGDAVCLFNGDGREYHARVASLDKKGVTLTMGPVASPQRELGFRLEVAAPVPKGDRAQFLVEKLTELGVSTFVPLAAARSVVHPREAKWDKLGRYVIEASKQCGRNVLMRIEPLTPWAEYCLRADLPERRLLGHPGGSSLPRGRPADVAIAVGPEGGFTSDEVQLADSAGWWPVSLGPRTLRVETAALVLAALASIA
jgi:16S rRNA (uracil1498-N3)-methyltransferase